jgi:hypothetical protein
MGLDDQKTDTLKEGDDQGGDLELSGDELADQEERVDDVGEAQDAGDKEQAESGEDADALLTYEFAGTSGPDWLSTDISSEDADGLQEGGADLKEMTKAEAIAAVKFMEEHLSNLEALSKEMEDGVDNEDTLIASAELIEDQIDALFSAHPAVFKKYDGFKKRFKKVKVELGLEEVGTMENIKQSLSAAFSNLGQSLAQGVLKGYKEMEGKEGMAKYSQDIWMSVQTTLLRVFVGRGGTKATWLRDLSEFDLNILEKRAGLVVERDESGLAKLGIDGGIGVTWEASNMLEAPSFKGAEVFEHAFGTRWDREAVGEITRATSLDGFRKILTEDDDPRGLALLAAMEEADADLTDDSVGVIDFLEKHGNLVKDKFGISAEQRNNEAYLKMLTEFKPALLDNAMPELNPNIILNEFWSSYANKVSEAGEPLKGELFEGGLQFAQILMRPRNIQTVFARNLENIQVAAEGMDESDPNKVLIKSAVSRVTEGKKLSGKTLADLRDYLMKNVYANAIWSKLTMGEMLKAVRDSAGAEGAVALNESFAASSGLGEIYRNYEGEEVEEEAMEDEEEGESGPEPEPEPAPEDLEAPPTNYTDTVSLARAVNEINTVGLNLDQAMSEAVNGDFSGLEDYDGDETVFEFFKKGRSDFALAVRVNQFLFNIKIAEFAGFKDSEFGDMIDMNNKVAAISSGKIETISDADRATFLSKVDVARA